MNNKWSSKYESCIACKTVEKRHMAKGLCIYCYLKQYHINHKDRIDAQKYKHYLIKQKPLAKQNREKRYFDSKRESALIRDNYTCVECGAKGESSTLIVHHKDVTGRNKPKHNNSMDNLVTLCRACHLAEHRDLVLGSRFKRGEDGWARHYDKCISCGTTELKHHSHGQCVNCHARYVRNNSDIVWSV